MRSALTLFLILTSLYILTLGGHIYSPDGEILFRTTEAIATRGSLAIEPLQGFATQPGRRTDGREYAQYGVGQPLAAVPFYWLGRALQSLGPDRWWVDLRASLRSAFPAFETAGGGTREARSQRLATATAARFGASLFNAAVTALSGAVLFLLAPQAHRSGRSGVGRRDVRVRNIALRSELRRPSRRARVDRMWHQDVRRGLEDPECTGSPNSFARESFVWMPDVGRYFAASHDYDLAAILKAQEED